MELLELPDNPIPDGAVVQSIVTDDGVTLRAAHFPANSRPLRGTVCLLQGRGEQIEKYFPVIAELRKRGFAVATLDWRGQGGSSRLLRGQWKGHVGRFADYGLDLDCFRRKLVLPDCPPPYFGLAHSMGGLILLANSPDLGLWLKRIVVTAPFLDFGPSTMSRGKIRALSRFFTAFGMGRMAIPGVSRGVLDIPSFEANLLTSDPEQFRIMQEIAETRPDLTIGSPTYSWLKAMVDGMDLIDSEGFPAKIPMPLLIVNCGAEQLVSGPAIERLARRMPLAGYVMIPGAKHEVMKERRIFAAQFWAAFDAFIPGSTVV